MERKEFRSALIFGGAGFIGANWARKLLEETEAKVHIFDNLSRPGVRHNLQWLQKAAGNSGRLQITIGDVRERVKVERAVRFATEVYHFAAQAAVTTSIADPRLDFEVNLGGTFNVLEAVRQSGHRPFLLFTSTNKVYGELETSSLAVAGNRYHSDGQAVSEQQPLDFHSPYGCSKGAADQYVRDYARVFGLPAVVFRMSCIAGPRQFGSEDQGWVAHFLYSALADQPVVIFGDGRQVRDVLCIDDLLLAFDTARLHRPRTQGQIYNVGGGPDNTTSLLELVDQIASLTGKRLEYVTQPRRPGDQLVYVSDNTKLHRDTGWTPQVPLRQTLALIHEFWKRNRHLFPEPAASAASAGTLGAMLQELPRTA